MTQIQLLTISPEIGTMIISGFEVILGGEEMEKISRMANLPTVQLRDGTMAVDRNLSVAELQSLESIMTSSYGSGGCHGIALHAGRAFFSDCFRRFGPSMGLLDQKYRMLSNKKRIIAGLNILAGWLSQHFNVPFCVADDGVNWNFKVEQISAKKAWGDQVDPAMYFLIGILQEYLLWAGGGKVYPVYRSGKGEQVLEILISKKTLS
jgi:hypothetical protein